MESYNFDEIEKILDNGYQIYFTYLKNRYLLFKSADNCYTQKLIFVRTEEFTCKTTNDYKKIYSRNFPIYRGIGI